MENLNAGEALWDMIKGRAKNLSVNGNTKLARMKWQDFLMYDYRHASNM